MSKFHLLASRTQALKDLFCDFAKAAKGLAGDRGIEGMRLTDLAEDGTFSVAFAGRMLRFEWVSTSQDAENATGRIYCRDLRGKTSRLVASIDFDVEGEATIQLSSAKDRIRIHTERGARTLVLVCLAEALKRTPPSDAEELWK